MSARASSLVVSVALALVVGAGCKPDDPPPNECAVYLACFFPDGGTTYPLDAGFDGGVFVDEDGVPGDPERYDYDAFHDEDTQRMIFDAFGTGGYCWRSRLDGTRDTALADACRVTCRRALVADCARRDAFFAGTGVEEPYCLSATDPADDLSAHGSDGDCAELADVDGGG
jgi:hypothetical protein